ncbi:MAG: trxA [Pedosphaera sp.]|nr:trxA [Pedosphaera sp.]
MRRLLIVLLVCGVALRVAAGEVEWLTDLPVALAKAKAEQKRVLLDFTGSDWCPPCQALKKNVLSSPEFGAYAQTNLVLVEVDFPNGKAQSETLKQANEGLKEKFGVSGFPTTVLLDAEGKELRRAEGYDDGGPRDFIAILEGKAPARSNKFVVEVAEILVVGLILMQLVRWAEAKRLKRRSPGAGKNPKLET